MDIQMPVVNGLEAIRQIKADEHLIDIPIVALSALSTPGHAEWCLETGPMSICSNRSRPTN
jgi:CheY-like chemotaxis protein